MLILFVLYMVVNAVFRMVIYNDQIPKDLG